MAQVSTGTLKVNVTDDNCEEVLGANVAVKLGEQFIKGAATDPMGLASISNLEIGSYTVVVTYVGFHEYKQTVTISGNNIREIFVKLVPSDIELIEVIGNLVCTWMHLFHATRYWHFGINSCINYCMI